MIFSFIPLVTGFAIYVPFASDGKKMFHKNSTRPHYSPSGASNIWNKLMRLSIYNEKMHLLLPGIALVPTQISEIPFENPCWAYLS